MKYIKLIIFFITVSFTSHGQSCIGTPGQVTWNYWKGFTSTPDSNALNALEFFPNTPTGSQVLLKLSTPVNFDNYYASYTRGYIQPTVSGTYTFNVTADDKAHFFLSTNDSPSNKIKRAEVLSYTGATEYTKYPSQTSADINLVAGQYYYFELYLFEGSGGDFVNISWKKNAESTWSIIDFNNIYDYGCQVTCAARGTACNDGNPLTTNDTQDGFCNCVGTMPTTNLCIGQKGVVDAYYYDNITGSYVENDLLNAPKFPLLPDRKENLLGAYGPLAPYTADNYGTLVQGYLTVPITGMYEFNITGDNQTFFFLSKNDSIQYKQYHQLAVISGVGEYDHNTSVLQSSSPILLEKGKYYYYEFRHKENTWRDFFSLHWRTPFNTPRTWKKVPANYLFDYKCEVSCIPQNTLCDDGNPFTNNDKINANCECVGTPCTGPDCNDLGAKYKVYDDCSPTNSLTTLAENTWQSCTSAPNPNTARSSATHWIKYSFEDVYILKDSRVWNFNVPDETSKGFKNVVVDYSNDGTTWTALGSTYTWPQAPGTTDYAGFIGPNFNDQKAKYVLVSALDNYGSASCSGFSKIAFEAQLCNPKDTPCDDGDPLTSYDKFDNNCNCRGVDISCGSDTLLLGNSTLSAGTIQAKKRIESNSMIPTAQNISFTAGKTIVLLPGFEIKNNAVFSAVIQDCIQQQFMANEAKSNETMAAKNSLIEDDSTTAKLKNIIFRINKPGMVRLNLLDSKGNSVVELINAYQENLGTQQKFIPTQKLKKGRYEVELIIDNNKVSEFFVVE